MNWYRIKRRPADILFSNYIRERDNWKCVYKFKCYGQIDFRENKAGLATSHFYKRRKESVRFDPDNADASCLSCHRFVEDSAAGVQTLQEFKKKQLGEKRFNALWIRSNLYQKKDDKITLIYLKALIKTNGDTTTPLTTYQDT